VLYQSKKIQERKNKYKNSQAQPVDRLKKQGRTKHTDSEDGQQILARGPGGTYRLSGQVK